MLQNSSNFLLFPFLLLESQNVDFVCSVLVVADQLLITRLKEMCEVALAENREYFKSREVLFPQILT